MKIHDLFPSVSHADETEANGHRMYHIYECTACEIEFGVSQALEDHSDIKCCICLSDKHLEDVCEAEVRKKG